MCDTYVAKKADHIFRANIELNLKFVALDQRPEPRQWPETVRVILLKYQNQYVWFLDLQEHLWIQT